VLETSLEMTGWDFMPALRATGAEQSTVWSCVNFEKWMCICVLMYLHICIPKTKICIHMYVSIYLYV